MTKQELYKLIECCLKDIKYITSANGTKFKVDDKYKEYILSEIKEKTKGDKND